MFEVKEIMDVSRHWLPDRILRGLIHGLPALR